jgi:hypothetical protein
MKTMKNFRPRTWRRHILACMAVTAVLTIFSTGLKAADADLPSGPALSTAAEFSQWVVTYTYPEEKDAGSELTPAKPKPAYFNTLVHTITTTKTRSVVHEEFVDEQGLKSDLWHVGTTQYQKPAGSPTWQQHGANELTDRNELKIYSPLPNSGFRDLDWITRQNYVTTIKYGEHAYLVFVPNPPPGLDLSNPDDRAQKLAALASVALIDATTRLPFQVTYQHVTRTYQFGSPPSDVQNLPDDLAQAIKQGREGAARLDQAAPRGY